MVLICPGLCIYLMSHQKKFGDVLSHFVVWPSFFVNTKKSPKKYKGNSAITPFLLLFFTGRSNQPNSFARMLHFYCFFHRHPYWPHFNPYDNMTIWPYGHILTIWPLCHFAIWPQIQPIWVSIKTAIKMQHSDKGIKLIGPSSNK